MTDKKDQRMPDTKPTNGAQRFQQFRDELGRASTGLLTLLAHGLGNLHGHPDQDALLGAMRAELVGELRSRKTQRIPPAKKAAAETAPPSLDTALEQALGEALGAAAAEDADSKA